MGIEGTDRGTRRVEQRANRRRSAPLRCWLSDGVVDRYASLVDISRDGARVATVSPPPVGGMVTLRFRLAPAPAGDEVQAVARVVWRSEGFRGRGGVVGLQFKEVIGASAITAFVEEG